MRVNSTTTNIILRHRQHQQHDKQQCSIQCNKQYYTSGAPLARDDSFCNANIA